MPKGLWLILPAAFIDLAGAGIAWAFIALGGTLGTVGGGAGGYLAGQALCNNAGFSWISSVCGAAGATVGAVAGSALNAPLATIGMPLGFALGYAIQVCLGLTFGVAFIIFPLALMGMMTSRYAKYLFMDAGKLVPVLGWLPFWSAFVICCVWEKRKETKKTSLLTPVAALKIATNPATVFGAVTGAALGATAALNADKQRMMSDIRPPQRNYESAVA